jgi:anti-sigma factor RsiW
LIEHLTPKQVEAYSRQQLVVAELLAVSDHLGECEACRRKVESATDGDALFLALRAELFGEAAVVSGPRQTRAHLTAEQMAGYVDRELSGEELETIADHLTGCEQCALAVYDLDAFRDQVAPSIYHEYRPASVASQPEGW